MFLNKYFVINFYSFDNKIFNNILFLYKENYEIYIIIK